MKEEGNLQSEEKKTVTVKNIIRILAFCCAIMFFCPVFMVSCSSSELMKISAMKVMTGISSYGRAITEPEPVLIICLLIPAGIIGILFVRNAEQKIAAVISLSTLVDLIVWILFRNFAKKYAEQNLCQFKTMGWYVVNIILLLSIMILSLAVLLKKIQMEKKFINIPKSPEQKKEKVLCEKCGNPIAQGDKFCIVGGTPISESIPSKSAKKVTVQQKATVHKTGVKQLPINGKSSICKEKTRKCPQCGGKINADTKHCKFCGFYCENPQSYNTIKKIMIILSIIIIVLVSYILINENRNKKQEKMFSDYLKLTEKEYTEISDEYTDTVIYTSSSMNDDGTFEEMHELEKEFTDLPGEWKVHYYYTLNPEYNETGDSSKKLTNPVVICEKERKPISEVIAALKQEYGEYQEKYKVPFNYKGEEPWFYQWNYAEQNHAMILEEYSDYYEIVFLNRIEKFDENKVLQPVYQENKSFEKFQWNDILNSYKKEEVEDAWDENYTVKKEKLEKKIQEGYQIKETVLEYFRVNDLAAPIWIADLGKSAADLFLDKEEEFFLIRVNFNICHGEKEKNEEDYILVGKTKEGWKICNMPAILNVMDNLSF